MKVYVVTIPEDIEAETGSVGERGEMRSTRYSFVRHFVNHLLLSDAGHFGKDFEALHAAQEIRGAFVGKRPGARVSVPARSWERGRDAIEKPTNGYAAPNVWAQCPAFFSAWRDAEPHEAEIAAKPKANGKERVHP